MDVRSANCSCVQPQALRRRLILLPICRSASLSEVRKFHASKCDAQALYDGSDIQHLEVFMLCQSCARSTADSSTFCNQCGARLSSASQPSVAAEVGTAAGKATKAVVEGNPQAQ